MGLAFGLHMIHYAATIKSLSMKYKYLKGTYEKLLSAEKCRYAQCKQDHVFNHISVLSVSEKQSFLKQLQSIEVQNLAGFLSKAEDELRSQKSCSTNTRVRPFSGKVEPIVSNKDLASKYYGLGIDAIRKNLVAALLLAGGQVS